MHNQPEIRFQAKLLSEIKILWTQPAKIQNAQKPVQ